MRSRCTPADQHSMAKSRADDSFSCGNTDAKRFFSVRGGREREKFPERTFPACSRAANAGDGQTDLRPGSSQRARSDGGRLRPLRNEAREAEPRKGEWAGRAIDGESPSENHFPHSFARKHFSLGEETRFRVSRR